MLFSRIAAPIVLLLSFGATVFALPTAEAAVEKRASPDEVEAVLADLAATTAVITPQITALTSSGSATDANVMPLINELIAAFNNATTILTALPTTEVTSAVAKRQGLGNIGTILSGLISSVLSIVTGVLGSGGLSGSSNLLGNLLPLVTGLLSVVTSLLPSVLSIVTGLLGGILGGGLLGGLLGGL